MINVFTGLNFFLSNFYACNVMLDGITYRTVEHAYQAAKTLDGVARERIRLAGSAGQAKRLGGSVILRPGWGDMKIDVMRSLLRQKFALGSELGNLLVRTGDHVLIEGNYWHDTFWGVCKGVGENHLGKLLMEIRAEQKR